MRRFYRRKRVITYREPQLRRCDRARRKWGEVLFLRMLGRRMRYTPNSRAAAAPSLRRRPPSPDLLSEGAD